MSSEPNYMVCLECETPCYTFEWNEQKSKATEVFCQACGNDKLELFNTEEEYEEFMESA
jgi:hypothetical protein